LSIGGGFRSKIVPQPWRQECWSDSAAYHFWVQINGAREPLARVVSQAMMAQSQRSFVFLYGMRGRPLHLAPQQADRI